MSKCALYRHFDEHAVLLYVGITDSPSDRGTSHAHGSDWTAYAAHGSITWYPSRVAALGAEAVAIAAERPVWNVAGTHDDQPTRVEEYLTRRRRLDAEVVRPMIRSRRAQRSAPTPDGTISLPEACRAGVLSIDIEAAKSRRRRADFPPHIGEDTKRGLLYDPVELRAYDMDRSREENAG